MITIRNQYSKNISLIVRNGNQFVTVELCRTDSISIRPDEYTEYIERLYRAGIVDVIIESNL